PAKDRREGLVRTGRTANEPRSRNGRKWSYEAQNSWPGRVLVTLLAFVAVLLVNGCAGVASTNGNSLSPVLPAITTQPVNQTVTAGQTATFTVVASGTAPLSYQWQKNGANIAGATSSSYTTPATTIADSGATFDVVVSNSIGNATSNLATLTASAAPLAPKITTQPVNQTVTAGQTTSFTVVASGTAPLGNQW